MSQLEELIKAYDGIKQAETAMAEAGKGASSAGGKAEFEGISKALGELAKNIKKAIIAAGRAITEEALTEAEKAALRRIGITLGRIAEGAVGKSVSKVAGGLADIFVEGVGRLLGPIFLILTEPSQISGIETRIIDTFDFKILDKCYRISFVQFKGFDELIWSDVKRRIEEIPCEQARLEDPAP